MWPLVLRWAVIGAGMFVGSKAAEYIWGSVNEEEIRHTWTGRPSDVDTSTQVDNTKEKK
jgi:hypothetical protein